MTSLRSLHSPLMWLTMALIISQLYIQLAAAQSTSNSTSEDDHDHDHDHDEEHKAGIMKGVAILTISVLALSISAVVTFVPHFRTSPKVMTLMSSYAAGVFVLVGLCHMIPEGVEAVSELYSEEVNDRFRPGYMMALAGYFFMIFVQRGIFKVEHTHHFETVEKVQEISMTAVISSDGEPVPTTMVNPALVFKSNEHAPDNGDDAVAEAQPTESVERQAQIDSTEKDPQPESAFQEPSAAQEDGALLSNPSPFVAPQHQGEGVAAVAEKAPSEEHGHSHGHEHSHSHGHGVVLGVEAPKRHRINTAALLGALMIHSLADGIAIGIQKEFRDVLVVYVAVIVHHWTHDMVFAYEAGLAIESRLFRMILCTIQSLVTAVGVGVGWALENNIPSAPRGYITAFCGGTFLMIGMTDLVPEEMMVGRRNLPQLLAFFVGAGTMYAVLAGAWTEAAHDHGGEGHVH